MMEHPVKTASREWRTKNPERYKQLQDAWNQNHGRAAQLKSKFRMTEGQVDALFQAQGSCCAICGTTEAKKWCIDHNHKCCPVGRTGSRKTCGKCVRGILCDPCNVGIAKLGEDTTTLTAAIEYLNRGV